MLVHPQFNPIAVSFGPYDVAGHQIGPIQIHWYGLMYLVAFGLFYTLANVRARKPWFAERGWTRRDIEDLLFYGVMGVVLGGRLGYVLFYKPAFYATHPLDIFKVWEGGMSFHGGLIGVLVAMAYFARRRGFTFFGVADLVAPCVPLGLGAGRMGNFINGELWGRFADPSLPWAMVFPQSGSMQPRHPSELYEFGLEGIVLFALLWWFGGRRRAEGEVSALFLIGYGLARFISEYFREPDSFLGLRWLNLSQGQWLSLPMIVAGVALWAWSVRRARASA
jgi:phosphatidylglycerol:prolipoprotein diacylglycerol transferase